MTKLSITWEDGIDDTTSYLLSFAKAVGTAVKNSPYKQKAEDIVATSGFAFRMWVAAEDLSPSAMSSWDYDCLKAWIENGGLQCSYVGNILDQEDMAEKKRKDAIQIIRSSIDQGIPAVTWNIGGMEWGLITGYDDEKQELTILAISNVEGTMKYSNLGDEFAPILSVLTITGVNVKSEEDILNDTLRLAVSHLKGEEKCSNVTGLEVYPVIFDFFNEKFDMYLSWNMEYYLGTFGALKHYAYLYFMKQERKELAELYLTISGKWKAAFDLIRYRDITGEAIRNSAVTMLKEAYEAEKNALGIMETYLYPEKEAITNGKEHS